MELLHILVLVCIMIPPRLSQPTTYEMYNILQMSHETACISEDSECFRGIDPPLPRETNHSLPTNSPGRLPREIIDPMGMKRSPRICCGFCSCDPDCMKHGSCCLSWYESLSQGRILTKNTRLHFQIRILDCDFI